MRILLDECLPGRKLKAAFDDADVRTVADMGWRGLENGALLAQAEYEFDAFVTVDRTMQYQLPTARFDLIIVVLHARSNRIEHLLPLIPEAKGALRGATSGNVIEVGKQPER